MTSQAIARSGQQSIILQMVELAGVGDYRHDGSDAPASLRDSYSSDLKRSYDFSFRPTLYVSL